MDQTKYRKNKETTRKPYRSNAAFYTDYKDEIPDGDYYGLKHSEFKKPWLPASGYDEMEYKWDFPLEYLNPISVDFEVPDMGKYKFHDAPTVNPNWTPPRWNPQYPTPEFPKPKPYAKKKPGTNGGTQIVWTYCEGQDFEFCPGETVPVKFTEYTTDRIESVDAGEGEIIPPTTGRLGESKHRPGYPEGTFTVAVKIPETAGMTYDVTSTTKSGETCVSRGTQRSNCLSPCGEMSVGYTSPQMTTGTSQTLTVQDGDPHSVYSYELSGGGTLKDTGNGTMLYTAPDSNPNCADDPTITVRDKRTGTVCATLKMGVGDPASTGVAYIIYKSCEVYVGPMPSVCSDMGDMLLGLRYVHDPFQAYLCDGTKAGSSRPNCGVQSSAVYTDPLQDLYYLNRCYSLHEYSGTVDVRTDEQKLSGCCPAALI